MQIRIESSPIEGTAVIVPEAFEDARGFFFESFRVDQFRELGLPTEFAQDNHSRSAKGVVRGLSMVAKGLFRAVGGASTATARSATFASPRWAWRSRSC